jgi:hypothetical protein
MARERVETLTGQSETVDIELKISEYGCRYEAKLEPNEALPINTR